MTLKPHLYIKGFLLLTFATISLQITAHPHEKITPKIRYPQITDSNAALLVSLAEYAIKTYHPSSAIKALKTFGIGPCLAISFYHPESQTGVLTHIDAMTKVSASFAKINTHLSELQLPKFSNTAPEWQVHIIGGNALTKKKLELTLNTLENYGFKSLMQNTLTLKTETAWLDLKTGTLYKFQMNPKLESNDIRFILPFMTWRALTPSPGSD